MTVLTAAERRLGWFMLGSGVVYLLGALFFSILPEMSANVAGFTGSLLGFAVVEDSARGLWHPLACGLMFAIASAALMVGIDPRRNRTFAIPVIVSKGSTVLLAVVDLMTREAGASTLGIVVTDFPLFLVTAFLYIGAMRSVGGSWLRNGPPFS